MFVLLSIVLLYYLYTNVQANCEMCHDVQNKSNFILCMGQLKSSELLVITRSLSVFQFNPSNTWHFEDDPVQISSKWPDLHQELAKQSNWNCFIAKSLIIFTKWHDQKVVQYDMDTSKLLAHSDGILASLFGAVVLSSTTEKHYVIQSIYNSYRLILAQSNIDNNGKLNLVETSQSENEIQLCRANLDQIRAITINDNCPIAFGLNVSSGFLSEKQLFLLGPRKLYSFSESVYSHKSTVSMSRQLYINLVVCPDDVKPEDDGNPFVGLLITLIAWAALVNMAVFCQLCNKEARPPRNVSNGNSTIK